MTLTFPVAPMLATRATSLPTGDGWGYEVKWDGYRCLAFVNQASVRLQSRSGHDVTADYPELANLGDELHTTEAILDGELVVVGDDGRPDFGALQTHVTAATFVAFDVLQIDGIDAVDLPLRNRRALLEQLVEPSNTIRLSTLWHDADAGVELWHVTAEQGLEGVVAKRLDAHYEVGKRAPSWRKLKHRRRMQVVIGGFTASDKGRAFGALLVGRPRDDEPSDPRVVDAGVVGAGAGAGGAGVVFAGGVGTGFSEAAMDDLATRLDDLITDICPFTTTPEPKYTRAATWVAPILTAEVEYSELSNNGHLRHASFLRLM